MTAYAHENTLVLNVTVDNRPYPPTEVKCLLLKTEK